MALSGRAIRRQKPLLLARNSKYGRDRPSESARRLFVQNEANLLIVLGKDGVVGAGVGDSPTVKGVVGVDLSNGFSLAIAEDHHAGVTDFCDPAQLPFLPEFITRV